MEKMWPITQNPVVFEKFIASTEENKEGACNLSL